MVLSATLLLLKSLQPCRLFAGHKTLCEDFFERSSADCFWHAPVRNFYEQLLQLFYLDPKPVLRLWHALATGPTAAGKGLFYSWVRIKRSMKALCN